MNQCARCGSTTSNQRVRDYAYCDECKDLFAEIRENEVLVMQRKPRAAAGGPDTYYSVTDNIGDNHEQQPSQVDGLAAGINYMDKHDCRGLFQFQDSGSRWLISEYLSAHPGIADDVDDERSGFFSKLF